MEDEYVEESVRDRLILSGMAELEEHGVSDFSLRRAAMGAQVSCAAPYRHFKDKEDYIGAIVRYVHSKWELLGREIERIYHDDPGRLCVEMCIASMRFRIANPNVRSVFTLAAARGTISFDEAIIRAVGAYAAARRLTEEDTRRKTFVARALVSGALSIMTDHVDDVLSMARATLEEEFI